MTARPWFAWHRSDTRPGTPRNLLVMAAALVLTSCGGPGGATSPADSRGVRRLVGAALEHWKAGRPDSPVVDGQPLQLDDEDFRAHVKLLSYEIRETPPEWTEAAGLAVRLSLRDRKGRPVVRHAVYLVSRHPDLTIRRDD